MSERYYKLFTLPENLYAAGSPVVIAAGALLKDNQTGKVLAQLKIKNIGTKSIKAAKVNIQPLDTVGNPLGGEVAYQYLDLVVTRDNEFGQKSPIAIADASTRAYRAAVTEVVFADNTIWKGAEGSWDALSVPATLDDHLKDRELVKQYRLKFGADCKYAPTTQKDLWYCSCGALNHADESSCHICHESASALLSADITTLKKECDERIAAEQKIAAAEKSAADAKAKKQRNLAMIAAPVAILLIIVAVMISMKQIQKAEEIKAEEEREKIYNSALSAISIGRNEVAYELFQSLGDYKDAALYQLKYFVSTEKYTYPKYNICQTTEYEYDDEGRLIRSAYRQTKGSVPLITEYYYDSDGKMTSVREDYWMLDSNFEELTSYPSTLTVEYNEHGDIVASKEMRDSIASDGTRINEQIYEYSYQYEYNDDGTMAAMSYIFTNDELQKDGTRKITTKETARTYKYTYDDLGRVLTCTEYNGDAVKVSEYYYDTFGNVISIKSGDTETIFEYISMIIKREAE